MLHYVEHKYLRPRNQQIAQQTWERHLENERTAADDEGVASKDGLKDVERVLSARSA